MSAEGFAQFLAKAGLDNAARSKTAARRWNSWCHEKRPTPSCKSPTEQAKGRPQFRPEAAKHRLKSFTVAKGPKSPLFASEPMVRNPTDMDIDERGRVWITEASTTVHLSIMGRASTGR